MFSTRPSLPVCATTSVGRVGLIFITEATGTPEPGGWTTRELLVVLQELSGLNVVGADVVEVAPDYDTQGELLVFFDSSVCLSDQRPSRNHGSSCRQVS